MKSLHNITIEIIRLNIFIYIYIYKYIYIYMYRIIQLPTEWCNKASNVWN